MGVRRCLPRRPACSRAAFVATLFTACATAAPDFTGTIRDATGTPVSGAAITVWEAASGKGFRTTTSDGRFVFSGLGEGDYLLKVGKTGMALLYGAVQMRGRDVHELDPVLVADSSAREPTVKADPPYRKSVPSPEPSAKPVKVKAARLIRRVSPVYPDSAKNAGVAGKVNISAILRTNGTLDDLIVLSAPHPDLALAALIAVREWRYSPTSANGTAVEVSFVIDVNFELQ